MSYNALVIDDSPLTRKMIIRSLRLANIDLGEIFEAEDGEKGLQLLSSKWVDIVFVDINMPKMNGIEFVQKMSKAKLLEQIPVVIVSTERAEARIEQLHNFGIRAYLPKPFRPEDLRDVVTSLLAGKGAPHAP